MIIKTKRPARIFLVDTVVTAAAWTVFIFQFTDGVVFLLSSHSALPMFSFFGITLGSTATTLLVCVLVCTFNALLVYLWALTRKASDRPGTLHKTSVDVPPDILARHFSLSPKQLNDVQDSRVTVVYHSATGGITHLETGSLQLQQVSPQPTGAALRVA